MSKLVDPVHFFNARGMSVLTEDHLHARIRELEAQKAELERKLASAMRRLQEQGGVGEIAK